MLINQYQPVCSQEERLNIAAMLMAGMQAPGYQTKPEETKKLADHALDSADVLIAAAGFRQEKYEPLDHPNQD